jgi:hypothetical protein
VELKLHHFTLISFALFIIITIDIQIDTSTNTATDVKTDISVKAIGIQWTQQVLWNTGAGWSCGWLRLQTCFCKGWFCEGLWLQICFCETCSGRADQAQASAHFAKSVLFCVSPTFHHTFSAFWL